MNPLIQLKQTTAVSLVALGLACFELSTTVQAVSPAPDGGYPGRNTAEGDSALLSLTSGTDNTAIGFDALLNNTTALGNTAIGSDALSSNTTGFQNTAIGSSALRGNTTGYGNTATGEEALGNPVSSTGANNTASGFSALFFNTTGNNNTAIGTAALDSNTTGNDNTGVGIDVLFNNTTGSSNIALGFNAGLNLTTGSNNIDIGNVGIPGEAKKIRIGTAGMQTATFIAGIRGVSVPNGLPVMVGSNNQLGTMSSSGRFKEAIKPMDKVSESILALQPVTFRYKKEIDPDHIPQFGLVAEDVEKVNPDLVVRDQEGKPYSVRYDQVNAMLLNEFLKEQRKVQELEATIAKQQKDFQATATHQQRQIETLTAGLQKVSDQLEVSKPAPKTVLNNQ
jgi:Chaperone of endosialidase